MASEQLSLRSVFDAVAAKADRDTLAAAAAAWSSPTSSSDFAAQHKAELAAKAPGARTAALNIIQEIANTCGRSAEPFLVSVLDDVLAKAADPVEPVRAAAASALAAILKTLNPAAAPVALPRFVAALNSKSKWQSKQAALGAIVQLTTAAPAALSWRLPAVIPAVAECMGDARTEVARAAEATMAALCGPEVVANRDVQPFVPALISALARPSEVAETIHKLSATTFVQAVEPPVLAILVPVLIRGLAERVTAVKRKTAVIIENMAKLVAEPVYAAPLLPRLMPGLERLANEVSDPECRAVAGKAHVVLLRAAGETDASLAAKAGKAAPAPAAAAAPAAAGKGGKAAATPKAAAAPSFAEAEAAAAAAEEAALLACARTAVTASVPNALAAESPVQAAALAHVAAMAAALTERRCFDAALWDTTAYLTPVLGASAPAGAAAAASAAFAAAARARAELAAAAARIDEDTVGEELCNCEFSLAYGGKILLNTARLQLRRGQRYGLVGANGTGKTTLMRAISKGQVEGFPPSTELRTVYVEHDIDGDASDTPAVEYVLQHPELAAKPRAEVEEALEAVGFDAVRRAQPVGTLSGGWKMKLSLARVALLKASIVLLDEPTNHLDTTNVAWLENWLIGLTDATAIIVSHDPAFLDKVCTQILLLDTFKIRKYKGNLSAFVTARPEAKKFLEMQTEPEKPFKFPEPGYLEGVKERSKAILKMNGITFTYPGTTKAVLEGVQIAVSLASRVAVVGANGAGKSTMVKLLTGELEPQIGVVWRHPMLRCAYVAQHAFHHIEQFLDWTPSEYIQHRYASGEDREAAGKAARVITEEEQKKMEAVHVINGVKLVVEKLVSRRKLKNSYEYEVKWVAQPDDKNSWLPRTQLEFMGFGKMVDALDAREAANAGAVARPLTAANIAAHLAGLGLDPEFTLHSRMRGLSGGQKVRVVLGACTWMNPHIIVMDEPTNFLDRESCAGLAAAIRDFQGGVVLITHHRDFADALCQEQWLCKDGRLAVNGEIPTASAGKISSTIGPDEVLDAAGNVIKIERKVKLSRRDYLRKLKEKEARRKAGEDVSSDEEFEA